MSDLSIGLGVDAHRFEEGIPLVLASSTRHEGWRATPTAT